MARRSSFLLLALLFAAACGPTAPSSGAGTTAAIGTGNSRSPSASARAVSNAPSGSQAPAPSASDSVAPSSDTTPTVDPSAATPSDAASSAPSASLAASPCQPEGDNQSFWPGIATSVSWDVYCAVLPKGWVLSGGSYRLANGGKLLVSYKGPGGASVSLSEGSFCTDGSGCVPSGSDAGAAAFGSMPGTLVATDAGGYAIVVARGSTPSWLMVTSGLDEATTVSLGAALAHVIS